MTLLRRQDLTVEDGCRLLSDSGLTYADGAEHDLLHIVRSSSDISSLSDELESRAGSWAERYHLSKSRANVVRPFHITPQMTVLEIGAGCGAVTRWLGETGATVDAVEPMLPRARVLRERTRDLDNVEVFVGLLEDVPQEPTYDLVVVIGVLEYVGLGTADLSPYSQFLDRIAGVLKPGGTLVLAIENRLGVKYLAGSPEDHTGRVFDSVEGYPYGGRARTFSRAELTSLLQDSGLSPRVLGAFPDYKLPRLMMDDSLYASSAPQLARQLPRFPSPEWSLPRPRLAEEALLWQSFCEAGLAMEVPNSFVVVATAGETPSLLWPEDRLATYFATDRRAEFAVQSQIEAGPDGALVVHHRRLEPGRSVAGNWLVHAEVSDPMVHGSTVTELVRGADDEEVSRVLRRWVELLDAALASSKRGTPVDLIPTNLVVTPDGAVVPIDQEWWSTRHSRDHVLARGLLMTAHAASELPRPHAWPEATVLDLARRLAIQAGVDPDLLAADRWHATEIEFARRVQGVDLAPVLTAMETRRLDDRPERDFEALPRLRQAEQELRSSLETATQGWQETVEALRALEDAHRELVVHYDAIIAERHQLVQRPGLSGLARRLSAGLRTRLSRSRTLRP